LCPLVGALLNGFLGADIQRTFGRRAVHAVAITAMLAAAAVALFGFATLRALPPDGRYLLDRVFPLLPSLQVHFALALDPLSSVLTLVITGVGAAIHLYATAYMDEDAAPWRFFAYLNLFVFSMLLLVLGDSFLVLFFGWEGVGLCSYLLIGYWYREPANGIAGFKAFVVNRVGDWGFLIGVFLLVASLGAPALVFRHLAAAAPSLSSQVAFFACLLFFFAATGKSAQLPLFVWLPDAMAGPTPVSALIHAATMVTAGIYLIARLSFLFVLSPAAMSVVAAVGAITALFAATIGLFQYDIKKVLAYSTISQLGLMFVGVGVGAWWAAVFHLVTHACFKACLFLGAGSLIHAMHEHEEDPQDLRNMGGLGAVLPRTRWTYLVACWAIAGFPIAAGFYSKDEILARAFVGGGVLLWATGLTTALCTSFYMFRSYYLAFEAWPATDEQRAHLHESPAAMTGVMALLAAASVLTAALALVLERWLAPVVAVREFALGHTLELALMAASLAVAVAGWLGARWLYQDAAASELRRKQLKRTWRRLHGVVLGRYHVDALYDLLFVRPFHRAAVAVAWLDTHFVDGLVNGLAVVSRAAARLTGAIDDRLVDGAVNALSSGILDGGKRLRRLQTGRINTYVLAVVVGVVLLVVLTALV
jgi:NADH-quinone oxidoreductase subunit L